LLRPKSAKLLPAISSVLFVWCSRIKMTSRGKILITRDHIAAAGGIKAALDEAHSLASLQMTPRAMTTYEAVGSAPTDADGAGVLVQIEIQNEQELREALEAGAQALLLISSSPLEARRLAEIAHGFRTDAIVEVPADSSRKNP
jgi:nicotinate-nucleotide pyrophosphorylase